MWSLYSDSATYPLEVTRKTNRQDKKIVYSIGLEDGKEDKPTFKWHLESAAYNAKYMSRDIQNQLIELAGKELLDTISDRVRGTRSISEMAEDSSDES